MDFLIQKSYDRTAELDTNYFYENHYSLTSKRLRLLLYAERTKTHLYTFKKYLFLLSRAYEKGQEQGPGKVKVCTISFSVIKHKIISVSQLPE